MGIVAAIEGTAYIGEQKKKICCIMERAGGFLTESDGACSASWKRPAMEPP